MRRFIKLSLGLALTAMASAAAATTVSYDVSNVAGNTWQFDVSVANDTLGSPLQAFDVYFDFATYSNLVAVSEPASFAALVSPPVNAPPFFTADGAVTYADFVTGIAPGATLGGFIIQADYSGAGAPLAPTWDVIDGNFAVIDQGSAVANQPVGVPEPATLGLLGLGLIGVAAGRRRSR